MQQLTKNYENKMQNVYFSLRQRSAVQLFIVFKTGQLKEVLQTKFALKRWNQIINFILLGVHMKYTLDELAQLVKRNVA